MWYATRASGYTALILLSASVVLGVLTSSRESRPEWPRFVVQSLHRNVSLLVGLFLVIHILTSIIDPFAKLNFLDAFVPFIASYRPVWLGLGVVGFELLIAITATSLVRHRLGWRTWRGVHLFAYASWPVGVVHGLGTGTDTKSLWAMGLVAVCVAAVIAALVWRLAHAGPRFTALRFLGIAGSVVSIGALIVWMAVGPLQHGWAKAAGTPADLLARSGAAPTTAPAPVTQLPAGLNDPLIGTLVSSPTNATATLTDTRDHALQLVIVANADGSGTLTVTRSGGQVCQSAATIGNTSVTARCGGVLAAIQIVDEGNGAIGGTLTTQKATA
ncbi:MAG: ferric reductase-like transmembrane domain-containing protein [Candidatus Dormiibacterota bacterium]